MHGKMQPDRVQAPASCDGKQLPAESSPLRWSCCDDSGKTCKTASQLSQTLAAVGVAGLPNLTPPLPRTVNSIARLSRTPQLQLNTPPLNVASLKAALLLHVLGSLLVFSAHKVYPSLPGPTV